MTALLILPIQIENFSEIMTLKLKIPSIQSEILNRECVFLSISHYKASPFACKIQDHFGKKYKRPSPNMLVIQLSNALGTIKHINFRVNAWTYHNLYKGKIYLECMNFAIYSKIEFSNFFFKINLDLMLKTGHFKIKNIKACIFTQEICTIKLLFEQILATDYQTSMSIYT